MSLQIDHIFTENGTIYVCCAPGKKEPQKNVNRNLYHDLQCIEDHNIDCIICLIEDFEFDEVQISEYPEEVLKLGIDFIHYQIKDHYIPTNLQTFHQLVLLTLNLLDSGKKILIHCRGGVGRTGVLCACVLIHKGFTGTEAISYVRERRKGALKNLVQRIFIERYFNWFKGTM